MNSWTEIFQSWQDLQQQFIESLPVKLPDFNVNRQKINPWSLPHLETFMSWGQSAVSQSMELQSHWLNQWADQMESVIEKSTHSKYDMVNQVQESMKNWSENQAELWEYWLKMVEDSSSNVDNPEMLINKLGSWRNTINESLTAQTQCLESWSNELNIENLTPHELTKIKDKMQETMNGWLQLQEELWYQWFDFLSLNSEILEDSDPASASVKEIKSRLTQAAQKFTDSASQVQDNLEQISGIGPALAKKLQAEGIVSFKQIAELTDKEISNLEESIIKFPGRIRRENWVSQAAEFLNKGS